MTEKRKFNPNGPRKKPFYDTKRKVLVIPEPCGGNQPSGIPARGGPPSGIPAAGERSLKIERKYDGLAELPKDVSVQNWLGLKMLNAIERGDVQDPGMFAIEMGLNPYKFKHLADSNEYFEDCLDMAYYIIGERHKEEALVRKKDGSVFIRLFALYNKDYRRMMQEFKQSEASKAAATVVVMERIPDSPLVPILKGDGDE